MSANTPRRTADTMSDAIALSSPSGRMSKRARAAAERNLCMRLFGKPEVTLEDLKGERPPRDAAKEKRSHAARLRDLAARGMSVRKFLRAAEQLEAEALAIETK